MSALPRIVLPLCFAVGVLEGFDIQAIGVAAPRMAPALGLGPRDLGWIFFTSNLGLMLGAMGGGWIADRAGRKPVFVTAIVAFGLFTLATAWAQNVPLLLIVRFGAGLGLGAALTNMIAIAADVSRPEGRAFTTSALFCGVPLGGALVALVSQLLPAGSDWRALFVIGGITPMLLAVTVWVAMSETRVGIVLGMTRMPIGTALFAEGRARSTLMLWLAIAPTLMVLYLMLYWLPTLVAAKGLAREIAPRAAIAFNVAGIAGALTFGWLIDRLGARLVLGAGFAGFVLVAAALAVIDGLVPVLILSGLAGFLILGANYALYGLMGFFYPAAARGTGTGAAVGVGRLGSIVGPLLPGLLIAGGLGAGAILLLLVPAAGIAGMATSSLTRREQMARG